MQLFACWSKRLNLVLTPPAVSSTWLHVQTPQMIQTLLLVSLTINIPKLIAVIWEAPIHDVLMNYTWICQWKMWVLNRLAIFAVFVRILVLKGQYQRWRKCHVSSVKPCSIWCRSVLLSGLGHSQATVINHKQRGLRGDRMAKGADGLTQLGTLNPLKFQDLADRRDYLHNLIFCGTRKHLCLISQSFHWLFRCDLLLCASPCCFQFWYLS